jgi:hypothetical protein
MKFSDEPCLRSSSLSDAFLPSSHREVADTSDITGAISELVSIGDRLSNNSTSIAVATL